MSGVPSTHFCACSSMLLVLAVSCLLRPASSDFASDRAECADQLVGMATCLTYVEGSAKSPTPDCCSGFKQVVSKSTKCMCVLIKDRDEPALGFKINVTLALTLPSKCDAPTNVSTCPKLLNIPSNSKDAKEFYNFEKVIEGQATSSSVKGNSSMETGVTGTHASTGSRDRWLSAGIVTWLWIWSLVFVPVLDSAC